MILDMLKHNKAFLGDKNYHGEQQPILTPKIKLEHFFVPNISMFLEFKINGTCIKTNATNSRIYFKNKKPNP